MLSQITITKFIKEYVEMILQKVLFSSIDGVSDYSMCYHIGDEIQSSAQEHCCFITY